MTQREETPVPVEAEEQPPIIDAVAVADKEEALPVIEAELIAPVVEDEPEIKAIVEDSVAVEPVECTFIFNFNSISHILSY